MGQVAVVVHSSKASESPDRNHVIKDDTITTLQQNPKFESLYNQLGLIAETRKLATKMLISLAAKSSNVCSSAEERASREFLETFDGGNNESGAQDGDTKSELAKS
ncbi:hypothetical protein CCACVL1_17587 [Corchorus capsularis]|uniref:Uncharacterized protein n=1 Tax=Corchorus capsularis TaxID=210143 RepID=A0A1R3HR75_COCAP|nr:hypothetical protein CCACVL1_17587 [Corchorus capsularis]